MSAKCRRGLTLIPFMIAALTGCATANRDSQGTGLDRNVATARTTSSCVQFAQAQDCIKADPQPRLVTLEVGRLDESNAGLLSSGEFSRLRLTGLEPDPGTVAAPILTHADNPLSLDYWKLVGLDVKETFTAPARWEPRDWLVLGGVAAGIGTVAVFDEDIQKAVQRNRNGTVDDVFNAVEPFGAEYAAGVLGAFYAGGELFHDSRAKSVALDGAAASIIASGLILYPLKYTVGRSRPNSGRGAYHFQPFGGSDSFPSGHATEAFAVATAIAEHYESVWVKVGSYGLASMVGYARLNTNVHWASDVLAGAALGTFVSHVVIRFNEHYRNVSLQPIVGPDFKGAELCFSF